MTLQHGDSETFKGIPKPDRRVAALIEKFEKEFANDFAEGRSEDVAGDWLRTELEKLITEVRGESYKQGYIDGGLKMLRTDV